MTWSITLFTFWKVWGWLFYVSLFCGQKWPWSSRTYDWSKYHAFLQEININVVMRKKYIWTEKIKWGNMYSITHLWDFKTPLFYKHQRVFIFMLILLEVFPRIREACSASQTKLKLIWTQAVTSHRAPLCLLCCTRHSCQQLPTLSPPTHTSEQEISGLISRNNGLWIYRFYLI